MNLTSIERSCMSYMSHKTRFLSIRAVAKSLHAPREQVKVVMFRLYRRGKLAWDGVRFAGNEKAVTYRRPKFS